MQGPNWFIGHFEKDKVTLAANEVQMKHGIFVENCHETVIFIEGKFKSLQMNKCVGLTLVTQSCISGIEVMNCEDITMVVKGHSPSVTIDKCEKARLILNEDNLGCDIVTSKVSEFSISYIKTNGDEAKDFVVSEQLITCWNPAAKKFETKVYDKFM